MPAEPKDPKNKNVEQSADQYQSIQLNDETAGASSPSAKLADVIEKLTELVRLPVVTCPTPLGDTGKRLTERFRPVTVAFPPCSAEMLALIKTTDVAVKDDIVKYFDEYFKFGTRHVIISGEASVELDKKLLNCEYPSNISGAGRRSGFTEWFGDCCICSPCLTLDGNRNFTPPAEPSTLGIRRLFAGDVSWLFFFERMGIFQILGTILDAYACNGRLPISNGSLESGIKEDIIALVLEVMTRQTKMGMSSTVRDRGCTYQTTLGWTSGAARKLGLDTNINTGFNTLFHKFIFNALEFYKDKRLAVAIRGSAASVAPPSVATLITIGDTIDVLKRRFEAFSYGRNYYNTLSGIVWAIAGMSVIRALATTLGIPPAYDTPDEYIPAAYDILVLKRPVTSGDTNRYLVHKECAINGRDILLDLEVINDRDRNPGGELEQWLTQIEAKVEGYRTAYRTLTGVDLGASPNPVIEQQV